MDAIINGIQQIGIGVADTKTVFNWYRQYLGFDILLFSDEATATLMAKYTKGEAQRRDAYLSLNMRGGGGLEIWQFKDRIPNPSKNNILLGDLGINTMVLRSNSIAKTHKILFEQKLIFLTDIIITTPEREFFYFNDPWGNRVQVVQDNYEFCDTSVASGGVMGCVIGVSHMDTSLYFYATLLGYDKTIVDETVALPLSLETDTTGNFRRVLLQHSRPFFGGFGQLLGPSELELIQSLDRVPNKIYENRLWGDLGYIHICFDVNGMEALRKKAVKIGHEFTVDSANSFDMGDAAGHFSYVEDPDGTLIEFVETHKVPVLKAMGLFLNLKKRNPTKPLPKWLVKTLKLHKVKRNL
ncbi:MAG: catechol 2,3-dioxygenase-like lactoylglutathione lyase family enzyme [Maribacter sp.]|jgi:catechol 2,3-dioxygenase-like lactoylglutathione lyase family enzyme